MKFRAIGHSILASFPKAMHYQLLAGISDYEPLIKVWLHKYVQDHGCVWALSYVLDRLEIEKVRLVGASAGGIVSLRFAHDFPQRLHSLSLVASTPKLAQMGAGIDAGVWRRTLENEGTEAWLLSDAQKRFGFQAEPGLVEWYAAEGGKTPSEAVLALQNCLLKEDLTPLLPRIPAPTLIFAAAQDEITPPEVQYLMAQQIPNASLQTFEGVGHNMKVEILDSLAGRVRDFVGVIDSGQKRDVGRK